MAPFARRQLTVALVLGALAVPVACSSTRSASPSTVPATLISLGTVPDVAATSAAPPTTPESSVGTTVADSTTIAETTAPGTTWPAPGSVPDTFVTSLTLGPGPFDLADTSVGLAALASHTATLTTTFTGTDSGGPVNWSITAVAVATNDPAARQITVTKTGAVADPTSSFMAEARGVHFDRRGTGTCSADAIDPQQKVPPQFEPATALAAVIGADPAGSGSVNGTPVDHYTFDERALGHSGRATSAGEMWIASTGGYVVKYVVTTKGGPDWFGDGIEGTLTQEYEVTGVGQPTTITVPDDCPRGLVDAPLLADATNVDRLPGVTTFDTASNLPDVVAFYERELATLGWAPAEDPTVTDTDATAGFDRANDTLTVSAAAVGGVTNVQLLLMPLITAVS